MATFNFADLASIEKHLTAHPYLSGEAFPGSEDVRIFTEFKGMQLLM